MLIRSAPMQPPGWKMRCTPYPGRRRSVLVRHGAGAAKVHWATRVRYCIALARVGEKCCAGWTLWALLARVLPEPWRVTCVARVQLARGDGPLAGVFAAGCAVLPGHRMAGMLTRHLRSLVCDLSTSVTSRSSATNGPEHWNTTAASTCVRSTRRVGAGYPDFRI